MNGRALEFRRFALITGFFLSGVFPAIWFVLFDQVPVSLLQEDGLYEWLAAVACLVGSVISFLAFRRSGRSWTDRNIWLLLFALGFLILASEEISWGQRLFKVQVSPEILQFNYQNELNLHNARFVQAGNNQISDLLMHLLSAYLIVFPLVLAIFPSIDRLIRKIRFPVPGLLTVVVAIALKVANSICYRVIYGNKYIEDSLHVGEAFESLVEICLACVAVEFFLRETARRKCTQA